MASNAKNFDGEQKSPVQTLISHNLAQFCTIFAQFLHNRQWAVLFERNQIQAQKDGFPFLVHNLFSHLCTQKIPYQTHLTFSIFQPAIYISPLSTSFCAKCTIFPHLTEAESLRTKCLQELI
jgi:hypothetical protein